MTCCLQAVVITGVVVLLAAGVPGCTGDPDGLTTGTIPGAVGVLEVVPPIQGAWLPENSIITNTCDTAMPHLDDRQ